MGKASNLLMLYTTSSAVLQKAKISQLKVCHRVIAFTPQPETHIHYLKEYFTFKILKKEQLFHFPLLSIGRHVKKQEKDRSTIRRDLNKTEKWAIKSVNYKGNFQVLYLERYPTYQCKLESTGKKISFQWRMQELNINMSQEVSNGGKKVSCTLGCISKMVDTVGKNIFKIHSSIFKN